MTERQDVLVIGAGQAGLATGYSLQQRGFRFQILEAARRPVGSWPMHYTSLKLFSPARHSSLPGWPFPGDPERYPARNEVVAYLEAYATRFQLPVVPDTEVTQVMPDDQGFRVFAADGRIFHASAVVVATGTFRRPVVPQLPGQDGFQGEIMHSSSYQEPAAFSGKRVVVVGAGNSAVQIAVELSRVTRVSLAARSPVRFTPQRPLGRDVQDWISSVGIDQLPLGRFWRLPMPRNVFDPGTYRSAFQQQKLDQRPMFTRFFAGGVVWPDGREEEVDAVIFATGYRASLDCLRGTGALGKGDSPIQRLGVSRAVPGLYFVGLTGQRALSSATLRGTGRDADVVVRHLSRFLRSGGF